MHGRASLSVTQVIRGQTVHLWESHAALDMQIGSKWLLIPVVGKVWRDMSRLDVWASSMVLPAPPEEVEHHL